MAEGDLNRGPAFAQSAATLAVSRAYGVNPYQAGTWQRSVPKLIPRTSPGGEAEHYIVEFHVQNNPSKSRFVNITLKEHHSGAMIASGIVCYLGREITQKVFEGSLTIDGEIDTWQLNRSLLDRYK